MHSGLLVFCGMHLKIGRSGWGLHHSVADSPTSHDLARPSIATFSRIAEGSRSVAMGNQRGQRTIRPAITLNKLSRLWPTITTLKVARLSRQSDKVVCNKVIRRLWLWLRVTSGSRNYTSEAVIIWLIHLEWSAIWQYASFELTITWRYLNYVPNMFKPWYLFVILFHMHPISKSFLASAGVHNYHLSAN